MKIIVLNRNISQPLVDELPHVEIIPDSAILHSGKPFFVPSFSSKWKYEISIAFRNTRLGKNIAEKFANRYYDAFTIVAKTIPCDIVESSSSAITYAFDGSFILGEWIEIDAIKSLESISITIGNKTETISISQLEIDKTIALLSKYLTLKIGDIITPAHLSIEGDIMIDNTVNASIENINENCLKLKFK